MTRVANETGSESSTVDESSSRGSYGLWVLGIAGVLVVAWLGVRIATTVTQQKDIAAKRAANPPADADTLQVQVVGPVRASWIPSVSLEGTIEAEQRSLLGFKVGGRLTGVEVRLGDHVKAGQLLGRLDAGEAFAQQSAAKAQLEAAHAQVMLAQDTERRTAQLVKSGALTEANGVQAEGQRALAEAQAAAARAQLGLTGASLSNHTLTAPFAGVVTRAPSTRGAVVGPGEALFEIVDMSALRLKGSIGESDASLARVGSRVSIQTPSGVAVGHIRAVVGVLDAGTRRIPVEADVEPHDGLHVGSFVRATIDTDEPVAVWSVPGQALRPGSQDVVLVVRNGQLEERNVMFSVDTRSGNLLVRRGLMGNEQIVLSPRPEARSGDKVKTGALAAATPVALEKTQ